MTIKDNCYRKKLKTYSYNGKIVMAINKPAAADKLGATSYPEMAKIRKVKV